MFVVSKSTMMIMPFLPVWSSSFLLAPNEGTFSRSSQQSASARRRSSPFFSRRDGHPGSYCSSFRAHGNTPRTVHFSSTSAATDLEVGTFASPVSDGHNGRSPRLIHRAADGDVGAAHALSGGDGGGGGGGGGGTARRRRRYGLEFDDMVREFARFTDDEIDAMPSGRYRAMFHGVRAAANEPDVYRSFRVLYEDAAPLRAAGRTIFRYLRNVIVRAVAARRDEDNRVAARTGLGPRDVDRARRAFRAVSGDDDDHDDGLATRERLIASGLPDVLTEMRGNGDDDDPFASSDAFRRRFDADRRGRATFENFVVGLCDCLETSRFDVTDVLSAIERRTADSAATDGDGQRDTRARDERRRRHGDRFDGMLVAFEEWEERMPPNGQGRTYDIVRGCFTGAKNPSIVEGLRIVYTDYYPLRLAGDFVFKIASGVVERMM